MAPSVSPASSQGPGREPAAPLPHAALAQILCQAPQQLPDGQAPQGPAQAQKQAGGSGRKMPASGQICGPGTRGSTGFGIFSCPREPSAVPLPCSSRCQSPCLEQLPRPRSGTEGAPCPLPLPTIRPLSARPPGIDEFHMKYCALPSPALPPTPELPEGPHSLHIAQATSKPNLGFIMYIFVYFLNPAVMGYIINVAQGWGRRPQGLLGKRN